MSIYRGAGGSGDAVNDSSSEALITLQARDAALAAQAAAEAAQTAAELAETNAETAETNAETAETNAETAETNAETAATNAASSASAASTSASNASTSASAASTSASNASSSASSASTSATNAANSASTATTQATNASNSASAASTSATNASNSASAASTSATNAASSATAAAGSATNAASSATSASGSASTATTQATNASNSASAAATSATNASNSASAASTSATNASNSASAAATSATNASNSASAASTSASNAATSESNAATSATNAAASYDSFDDRYLGAKSSAPTLDNDGNALLTGALYFNTASNEMKVWSGSAWLNAYASLSGALLATNNLSDLSNTATARTNLGVAIGTNVQAYDAQLADVAGLTPADNNFIVGNGTNFVTESGSTARTSLGLGSIATQDASNVTVTGGSINGTTIGATTASTGKFTTLEATGVATFSAGTVSAPAITTTGDTNTGIFFPAADTIAFTEGGAESMRIDSSGNVGIGTSSPSVRLHVSTSAAGIAEPVWLNNSQAVGAGVGSRLVFTGTTSNNGLAAIDGAFAGATTADGGYMVFNTRAVTSGTLTERMRIDSSGNVGIGTTSPSGRLSTAVADGTTNAIYAERTGGSAVQLSVTFANQYSNLISSQVLSLHAGSTERGRFDTSGNFLFNSGYGSVATAYGCRAWVNWNGTGTVSIRASGNVSSITDNGTGDYTINYTNSIVDANYSLVGFTRSDNDVNPAANISMGSSYSPATGSARVMTGVSNSKIDFAVICVAIFR